MITINTFKFSKKEIDLFKHNFDLAEKKRKHSSFNRRSKLIQIRTALPNRNFIVKDIFITKIDKIDIILIHITDRKEIPRLNDYMLFKGVIKFKPSDIRKPKVDDRRNAILNLDEITIVIYNDTNDITYDNLPIISLNSDRIPITLNNDYDDKEPKEGGGGIIIKNP